MGSLFGGGGGGGGGATSGVQESIAREAPGVEARKLSLYDQAVALAQQPVGIPAYQVAGPSGLEQRGFTQAATTGVGAPAVGQGIQSLQAGLGAAFAGPNISQFFNPYQSYVTDEINRQAQIGQNQLSAQAVGAGAFGGGREGVQRAELDRARLEAIGQSQAQGFNTALGAAQQQQGLQAQTGLQAGQQFGQFGVQQQAMQQADIASLLQAGGVQRGLGQQALEATRATSLAQQYEPYQRVEFLKNIMTNLPSGQSSITATTAPGSNPLAQAAGAGLGAYTGYNLLKRKEGGLVSIKKFQEGGEVFSDQEKFAYLAAPVIGSLLQAKTPAGQTNLQSLFGAVGEGVSQMPNIALTLKDLQLKKEAEQNKATEKVKTIRALTDEEKKNFGYQITDEVLGKAEDGVVVDITGKTFDTSEELKEIRKGLDQSKISEIDGALRNLETTISGIVASGEGENLPGIGVLEGRFFTGSKGKILRAQLATFSNIKLKTRSGAAVTENEFDRLQNELAGGQTTKDESAFLATLVNARVELEKEKVNLLNQYDTRGTNVLIDQGGINFYESPGYMKMKVGAAGIKFSEDPSITIDGIRTKFVNEKPLYLNPKTGIWGTAKPITKEK